MTTSRSRSFLSNVVKAETISETAFVYFRGKLQNDIHVLILTAFLRSGLSQKELAQRTGKSTSVVNRWIGATGNWELSSIAELLAGMNAQLKVSLDFFDEKPLFNLTRSIQEPAKPQVLDDDPLWTLQRKNFGNPVDAHP
jgi:transcriptional regulator with XRE-family HTH domain